MSYQLQSSARMTTMLNRYGPRLLPGQGSGREASEHQCSLKIHFAVRLLFQLRSITDDQRLSGFSSTDFAKHFRASSRLPSPSSPSPSV